MTRRKFFAPLFVRMKRVPSRCSTSYLWPFSRGRTRRSSPPGRRRGEEPAVPGVGRPAAEDDELLVLRPPDPDREELVLLLVDLHRRAARLQAPQGVRALRHRVLGHVEDGPVVGGPGHARHPLRERALDGARLQVLDEELVLAEAGVVGRVQEPRVVVAHFERADREERQALRHLVLVEEHLLGGVVAEATVRPRGLAAADRVLQALDRPAVVVEAAVARGDAEVGLLDPAQHLRVERLAERLQVGGRRLGVGVLRLEVLHDLGRALLPQPVVGVHERPPVPDLRVVLAGGDRGRGRRRAGPQTAARAPARARSVEYARIRSHLSGPPQQGGEAPRSWARDSAGRTPGALSRWDLAFDGALRLGRATGARR